MKRRGRKHTPEERRLLRQVKAVFSKLKVDPGIERVTQRLNISMQSFYNYVNGKDLPRLEVLREAQREWKIKWEMIDPSEVIGESKVKSPEQYVFSFIKDLREEDIEIVEVEAGKDSTLRISLNIRIPV